MSAEERLISPEEHRLVLQYNDFSISRQECHSDAYQFLTREENACHWFCQHYALTKDLLEVLLVDHPQTRQIWHILCQQLGECTQCICYYHVAQSDLLNGDYEPSGVRQLLEKLWQLDRQRLLSWLQGTGLHQTGYLQDNSLLVPALYELLGDGYSYLHDAVLCSALVQTLQLVHWDVSSDNGQQKYPGLYMLLAHPDADVRGQALELMKQQGHFQGSDDDRACAFAVLGHWTEALQQLGGAAADAEVPWRTHHVIPVDQRQVWPLVHVMGALKLLLGLMEPEMCTAVLEEYPTLLPFIVVQACPAAAAAPTAVTAEGSTEHRHALGWLQVPLTSCKQDFWTLPGLPLSPEALAHQLQSMCWRALSNVALLRHLLEVLQATVESLLPCMPADDDVYVEEGARGLQDGFAAQCKLAAGACLRLLLVQLPGSTQVPLLIRGLALQAGLTCCSSALQCPACPSTANFCHLWGPVAADVLHVTADTLGLQGSPELQQHQAPGIVQLMPLLGEMEELRAKVLGAAADLVSLAVQVDAAVLHHLLDPEYVHPKNRSRLLPAHACEDLTDLALNIIGNYTCSPGLWKELAGCGHPTVSATFAAVAAELAPLTAAAVRANAKVTVSSGTAAALEASAKLPNPETVELGSSAHAVYVLEYVGWLHGRLLQAAARHLFICGSRSRFFLLPSLRSKPSGPKGTQLKLDALYQQLAESCSMAPDRTAAEPYALCVRSCCSLLLLGKDHLPAGPNGAHLTAVLAAAEQALMSSCGLGAGQFQEAVQQQLLAPGSACAVLLVEALQEALQELRKRRLHQVITEFPQRLKALIQLTDYCLGAAVKHGLDVMLPLFMVHLPNAWQLAVDCLTSSQKLLGACRVCTTAAAGAQQQRPSSGHQGSAHLGPPLVGVLHALLESLPTSWQCYQELQQQRLQQRRAHVASMDSSPALFGYGSQGSQRHGSGAGSGVEAVLRAEIQKEMKWIVHLLHLGGELHAGAGRGTAGSGGSRLPAGGGSGGSSSCGCSECVVTAATDQQLQRAWKTAMEGVIRVTATPLSKAVKEAAADLMRRDCPGLDKMWLAQLMPDAAPGNLAGTGLGRWPSRPLSSGAGSSAIAAAAGRISNYFLQAPTAAAAAAAATSSQMAATVSATAASSLTRQDGGTQQDLIDLTQSDLDKEWVGEWLSEGEDATTGSKEPSDQDHQRHGSENESDDVQIIGEHEEEPPSPRQQRHSSSWQWRVPAVLQQQQQQEVVKKGVSRLLVCQKTLNSTPAQKQKQQQQQAHMSLHDMLSHDSSGGQRGAAAAAVGGSDPAFSAVLQSLDAASKGTRQTSGDPVEQRAAAAASAVKSQVSNFLQPIPLAASKNKKNVSPEQHKHALTAAAAATPGDQLRQKQKHPQQQAAQPAGRQAQQAAADELGELDTDTLWPAEWGVDGFGDASGGSSASWNVGKYNFSTSGRAPRPRQRQSAALAGLSTADQVRADLLGKAPAGSSRSAHAAAAAGGFARQGTGRQPRLNTAVLRGYVADVLGASSAAGNKDHRDRATGVAAAAIKAADVAPSAQQQQKQLKESLQRDRTAGEAAAAATAALLQAGQQRQQHPSVPQQRQQQQKLSVVEQRQQEAAAAAAARQAAPVRAAAPTAVHLISDGALFARAEAANRSRLAAHHAARGRGAAGGLRLGQRGLGGIASQSNRGNAAAAAAPAAPPPPHYPPVRKVDVEDEVVSWGYLGAIGSSSGEAAVAAARQRRRVLLEEGQVPLRFTDPRHYCHVFRSLLLEELRAGLAASHEELVSTGGGRSGGGTGSFKCLPFEIAEVQRVGSYHVVTARVNTASLQQWERDSPRDRDFIVVTKVQLASATELAEDKIPRSHLSGLVVEASMEQPGVRLFRFKVCTASAGSELMANYWSGQLLRVRMSLWLTVVTSLVPNFREIEALIALQNAQQDARVVRQVLDPTPPPTPPLNALALPGPVGLNAAQPGASSSNNSNRVVSNMPAKLRDALMQTYNASQQAAVAASLDKRWPIVLVQGPPGTGKTSAILGIVSALLATQGAAAGPAAASGVALKKSDSKNGRGRLGVTNEASAGVNSEGSVGTAAAGQSALKLGVVPPVRIMVCAQSNAAIDELATRLANDGVWTATGGRRAPAMVRMGRSEVTHASVRMFHVDALADQHLQQQYQQQQQQQQQRMAGLPQTAAAQTASASAASAAAAEQQDAAQAKAQHLRTQLQAVEKQLAALAAEAKATTQGEPHAVGSRQARASNKQQQVELRGEKRGSAAAAVTEQAPKRQCTARATPPAAAAAPPATDSDRIHPGRPSSGSHMDLSDGERAAVAYSSKPGQQPSAEDAEQARGSRSRGSRAAHRSRSRSSSQHRREHTRERRLSRQRERTGKDSNRKQGGSRTDDRGRRRSRSRSRSRDSGRRSSKREEKEHSRHKRRLSSDKRNRSRSRSRSKSRARHRRSRRSRSRSRACDRYMPTGIEGNAAAADKHNGGSSRDETITQQKQQQPQQPTAGNTSVSESLLRDQQRALLSALRTAEMELQRNRQVAGARELERQRPAAKQEVVKAAEIVLCTLSAAGAEFLKQCPPYDVLVVDEAAQALEPATLIPMGLLKPGTGRVVLVGDPCQLPPTVLSRAAEAAMLAQSLFERLAKAGWPVTMLREQYRMHPDISAFPSRWFYDGKLVNGASITAASKSAPFHKHLVYKPFVVWDCIEGRERAGGGRGASHAGGSLRNTAEAHLAATLVHNVLQSYPGEVGSVAVISPYKAQVLALKEEFRHKFGSDAALTAANIEFGTVDGFQGRESDIVVFSCVRAQPEAAAAAAHALEAAGWTPGGGPAPTTAAEAGQLATTAGAGPRVGFLADVRRMNVGLTRGRRGVWVVCHANTLAASPAWLPLLQEARARGVLLEARAPFSKLCVPHVSERLLRGVYWTPPAPAAAAAVYPQADAAAAGTPATYRGTGPAVATGPAGNSAAAAAADVDECQLKSVLDAATSVPAASHAHQAGVGARVQGAEHRPPTGRAASGLQTEKQQNISRAGSGQAVAAVTSTLPAGATSGQAAARKSVQQTGLSLQTQQNAPTLATIRQVRSNLPSSNAAPGMAQHDLGSSRGSVDAAGQTAAYKQKALEPALQQQRQAREQQQQHTREWQPLAAVPAAACPFTAGRQKPRSNSSSKAADHAAAMAASVRHAPEQRQHSQNLPAAKGHAAAIRPQAGAAGAGPTHKTFNLKKVLAATDAAVSTGAGRAPGQVHVGAAGRRNAGTAAGGRLPTTVPAQQRSVASADGKHNTSAKSQEDLLAALRKKVLEQQQKKRAGGK